MYLDPSFGGMILQIAIAIIAASGAILFGMRRKISAFFKKNRVAVKLSDESEITSDGVVDMLAEERKEKEN